MIKLLQLEWKKFKTNAVTSLLGLLFLAIFPSAIFICKEMFKETAKLPGIPTHKDIFEFPGIWNWLGYDGNWVIFFFLGFIGIYIVTSEVGNKTMRQNIITGMTRHEFFMAKFYSILAISIFATLFYTIIAIAIGASHTADYTMGQIWDNDLAVLKYFLMSMGYLSFGLFLGFTIRKSGLAIFSYLSYVLFVEPLARMIIFFQIVQSNIVNFFPMNAIEDLMPNPMYRIADKLPDDLPMTGKLLSDPQAIISSSLYILIFLAISYSSITKRDI